MSESCPRYGVEIENYFHHYTEETPLCQCSQPMRRVLSGFNSPLMGEISSRYVDRSVKGSEGLGDDSHWVWERNTPDGKPRPRRITTFQEQKEYAKRENLLCPTQVGNNIEPREDGKGIKNSVGMPGCEV